MNEEGDFLNPYYNNIRDDDSYILAQGVGTGPFNPGTIPKLKANFNPI